jgi:hypothetical protein
MRRSLGVWLVFLWLWLCKVVFVFQMLASAANGMSGMGFNDNAPVQD